MVHLFAQKMLNPAKIHVSAIYYILYYERRFITFAFSIALNEKQYGRKD